MSIAVLVILFLFSAVEKSQFNVPEVCGLNDLH